MNTHKLAHQHACKKILASELAATRSHTCLQIQVASLRPVPVQTLNLLDGQSGVVILAMVMSVPRDGDGVDVGCTASVGMVTVSMLVALPGR